MDLAPGEIIRFRILYLLAALVVVAGMFVPVMEVDAAQYASISKQMWEEGSFLQIIHRNLNYLDKPPLLFWLSGASISLFGVSDFAYKLPSVLFSLLGVWSVFRLARFYYGQRTAHWAAQIYCCSVAFFIYNNDIRTDTILIALLAYIVYQLVQYRHSGKWINFISAFFAIGLAMTAKGPLGLVFTALAFGPDVLLKRQWKFLFNWKWVLGLFIVAIVLLPMCYGLFVQFDANPGAAVNQVTGVSGLKFYFWEQSFGRITGDSVWAKEFSNHPSPFYLFTSFLWAFLPWTPVFLVAAVMQLYRLVRQRFKSTEQEEWISLSAFLLPLLVLSTSGYQLNHYIYVVVPFVSILAARFYVEKSDDTGRWKSVFRGYAVGYVILLGVLASLLLFYVFPGQWNWLFLLLIPVLFFARKLFFTSGAWAISVTTICFFLVMNAWFYPRLLKYQAAEQAIEAYRENRGEDEKIFYYQVGVSHSGDFYNERWVPHFYEEDFEDSEQSSWIYTNSAGLQALRDSGFKKIDVVRTFDYHPVTILTAGFLNPATRHQNVEKRHLLRLRNKSFKKSRNY